jgi:hypothetical protein
MPGTGRDIPAPLKLPNFNLIDAYPQQFCHAPSLRNAANRALRRIAIEYLRNLTQAFVFNPVPERS